MAAINAIVHGDLHVTINGMDYWARKPGGYVWFGSEGCREEAGNQLCHGNSGRGLTIELEKDQTVLDVMRKQMRGVHLVAVDRDGDPI